MKHTILWEQASVNDSTLTVPLDPMPDDANWGRLFVSIASEPIPGVEYSPAVGWGPIHLRSGSIRVQSVDDRGIQLLKGQLNAAVEHTDNEYDRYRLQEEREAMRRRTEDQQAAERDDELTRRFRQQP